VLHIAAAYPPIYTVPHFAVSHCCTTKFISTQHCLNVHNDKSDYSITLATKSLRNIFSKTSIKKLWCCYANLYLSIAIWKIHPTANIALLCCSQVLFFSSADLAAISMSDKSKWFCGPWKNRHATCSRLVKDC